MSTQEIVKIDPKEFGIEDSKASDIAAQFQPMLDKMVELETEYNEVVNLPIEEPSTAKKAREVRLKYMKVRTGTLEIHKAQKAFYLAGGRFVDGWKNAQEFASLGKEQELEKIEKYAANLEKERIANLQAARQEQLVPYEVENIETLNLGTMADNVWENFLAGSITNYNAKKEAERLAEEAEQKRLAEEEAEREKFRIENERLREEAAKKELIREARSKELAPYIIFIREYNKVLDLEEEAYQLEFANIKKGAEFEWEEDRKREAEAERLRNEEIDRQKQANIEAARLRKEAEEQAKKEREEKEKLEKQLEAERKKQADAAAEAERLAELELSKGDADKMKSLVKDLQELTTKYSFKSKKHKTLYASINELIGKTVTYAESKM